MPTEYHAMRSMKALYSPIIKPFGCSVPIARGIISTSPENIVSAQHRIPRFFLANSIPVWTGSHVLYQALERGRVCVRQRRNLVWWTFWSPLFQKPQGGVSI